MTWNSSPHRSLERVCKDTSTRGMTVRDVDEPFQCSEERGFSRLTNDHIEKVSPILAEQVSHSVIDIPEGTIGDEKHLFIRFSKTLKKRFQSRILFEVHS